ncbi:pituitary tumor-transforming gene 1 protein-interacting protein [Gouania willdenowi]|uniref:Pituitary tumor-transforming gene 1 protein-interacting protein-like n=1 Tax=Gouania willdenowi TaxID=441366 RepID=A0A8C5ECN1_GOUWI|nr:pituitary tumor-transforming gene 1 protein-interacting protein-like [Gouania willdenowi]
MSSLKEQRTWTSVFCVAVLVYVIFINFGECQTTTPAPQACSTFTNCGSCVSHSRCLWCFASNNCTEYPVRWLLPPASVCQLSQARWGVCWLNFEALIITMAVLGGIILISIMVCCCCCCCRCKRRSSGLDRDEERLTRRREEIKQRSEERKVERKARHDEIRRKYGLLSDSDHPYGKFENE